MYSIAIEPDISTETKFQSWAAKWRKETGMLSSVKAMSSHPAYLRIIGLGPAVLPYIFNDLLKGPDHWFVALSAITGEEPITEEIAGNMDAMAKAWLQVAAERGWLPAESEKVTILERHNNICQEFVTFDHLGSVWHARDAYRTLTSIGVLPNRRYRIIVQDLGPIPVETEI